MATFLHQLARGIAVGLAGYASLGYAEGIPDRYERLAAPYQQANTVGKQQWLEELLRHRSQSACRVYLSRDEFARITQRHDAILARAAAGQELSEDGLARLLADVDAQEHRALDKLQRDYAFATAQAFHDDRAGFDKWNEAWNRIERGWLVAGQPFSWQPKMIAWLQQSTARQAQATLSRVATSSNQPVDRRTRSTVRAVLPATGPPIQRDELEPRIVGYNLALSRLISNLHAQNAWTTEDLDQAAAELTDLATARHDLTLYWGLLPPIARAQMPSLDPLEGAISLLASRTAQRRRQLETMSEGTNDRAAWELRRLDEVSRRLATLAGPRS